MFHGIQGETSTISAVISVFDHDEPGYARWLRDHPVGSVLNCDREPKASYLMLHRSSCRTISGQPARGTTWTVAYVKVSSDSQAQLDEWARSRTGANPTRCGSCAP